MTRSRRLVRLAAPLLVAAACSRSAYTGRVQTMAIDEDQALALADRAAQQYRLRIRPVSDPRMNERVNQVARRLIDAAKSGPAADRATRLHWEIVVVDDAQTNVAVLENGNLFVGAALVRIAATDAELAGPLGHAVAQVLLRHASERARPRFVPQAAASALGLAPPATSDSDDSMTPLEAAQMSEADYVGLLLAAEAGYDPELVLPIFDRLGEHERAARLRERLPEIRDALARRGADGAAIP